MCVLTSPIVDLSQVSVQVFWIELLLADGALPDHLVRVLLTISGVLLDIPLLFEVFATEGTHISEVGIIATVLLFFMVPQSLFGGEGAVTLVTVESFPFLLVSLQVHGQASVGCEDSGAGHT